MKARALHLFLLIALVCGCADELPKGPEFSATESPPQKIQERIEVGFGPSQHWEVLLLKSFPEPLWLLGAEISAVDESGEIADLDLVDLVNVAWTYPTEHNQFFFPERSCSSQIFRLSKELPKVMFPGGYGVPLWSNEPIAASVRWRNRNLYQKNTDVKLKLKLHFVRQRVAKEKLTALAVGELFAAAPLDSKHQYGRRPDERPLDVKVPRGRERKDGVGILVDSHGTRFSEEWLAPKGESVSEFLLSPQQGGLPGSEAIQVTAYVYPSVKSLAVVGENSELSLEEPFTEADNFQFQGEKTWLKVHQKARTENSRVLAYLLSYFPDESFQEFPEMRQ